MRGDKEPLGQDTGGLGEQWKAFPLALEPHLESGALANEVLTEQMRQFMARQVSVVSCGSLAAVYMFVVHWGRVGASTLCIWLVTMLCLNVLGIGHALLHQRSAPPPEREARWRHVQAVLAMLAGLCLGSSTIVFEEDALGLPQRIVILTTIASVVAIGLQPFPGVFMLFLVSIMAMPVYVLLHTGDPNLHLLAVGAIVLAAAYAVLQRIAARQMTSGIEEHVKVKALTGALSEAALRINKLATLDELTGLVNRRHAWLVMERLLAHARTAPEGFGAWSVLSLDVDHFKRINDTHGHPVGDLVLRAIAQRLLARVRPADTVARLGGEEFIVVLPDTARAEAILVAEKLRSAIAESPIDAGGLTLAATLSVGVLEMTPALSLEEAFVRVDQALYRAKHLGRNRVECAS